VCKLLLAKKLKKQEKTLLILIGFEYEVAIPTTREEKKIESTIWSEIRITVSKKIHNNLALLLHGRGNFYVD